jgi:hypothetical protein
MMSARFPALPTTSSDMRTLRIILVVAVVATVLTGGVARAQFGGVGGDAGGGLVNRAVGLLASGNDDAPGWMYYGINGADRGLGYNGSYMTVGGFFPTVQDDLGGIWSADVRGHLSQFGGFFSNVGAVRKQFIGGTLLGVGVYWDYDGDLNQYPNGGQIGTAQFGQFGHVYNQVGVSGEWLTDWGNLRSNGYIPVGQTAYTAGAPGSPFVANYLLCQYGLDAALGGADLEVGAYIPGLADWAGMISVGGYALGNDRYTWGTGTTPDQAVIPWFGGVYTRLDMTFLRNWDFSLQANNDSYFDWTGFARLTYRMGASRRRNVPDQMEQPMMRNEHIVRAHQTPVVAINPATGQPWNVIHVDNSAIRPGADGTNENPWMSLAAAQADAMQPYDIVFVRPGGGAVSPYTGDWQFQADNQILVGAGSTLQLNTASCGFREFFNTGTAGPYPTTGYPVLAIADTAVTLRNGAIVDHLEIRDARVGVAAGPDVTTAAYVNDVRVIGTNKVDQVGAQITGADGRVQLTNMRLENTGRGLFVNGGAGDVDFQGRIMSGNSQGEAVLVQGKQGGAVGVNVATVSLETELVRNTVFTTDFGIVAKTLLATPGISIANNLNTTIDIGTTSIVDSAQEGVLVQANTATFVTLKGLTVEDAGAEAFRSLGNDDATTIQLLGVNTLSSISTTQPAFGTDAGDFAFIQATVQRLSSDAPGGAIVIGANSTGSLAVTDEFLVDGAPGTPADVVNNADPLFTVTLP